MKMLLTLASFVHKAFVGAIYSFLFVCVIILLNVIWHHQFSLMEDALTTLIAIGVFFMLSLYHVYKEGFRYCRKDWLNWLFFIFGFLGGYVLYWNLLFPEGW